MTEKRPRGPDEPRPCYISAGCTGTCSPGPWQATITDGLERREWTCDNPEVTHWHVQTRKATK